MAKEIRCDCSRCKNSHPCASITGFCSDFKPTYTTNADRIRAMTDEELAHHFSELIKDTQEHEYCTDVTDWLNWLKCPTELIGREGVEDGRLYL